MIKYVFKRFHIFSNACLKYAFHMRYFAFSNNYLYIYLNFCVIFNDLILKYIRQNMFLWEVQD